MTGPDLAYVDIKPLLARLGNDLTDRIVLVGGQAVNFWEDLLLKPDAAQAPLTSKDIDFCGSRRDVELCAARLGGTARFPDLDDHTPNVGVVAYVDERGVERGPGWRLGGRGATTAPSTGPLPPCPRAWPSGPPPRPTVSRTPPSSGD